MARNGPLNGLSCIYAIWNWLLGACSTWVFLCDCKASTPSSKSIRFAGFPGVGGGGAKQSHEKFYTALLI